MGCFQIPFSPEENKHLTELYARHQEEYEGKFASGSQTAKRSKGDFCELWAKELSSLWGIAARTGAQV
ncbi:hypothetical protein L596_001686 [Steinernema carpocapsae]|uniref:Uncharacterized protein n=1 Tax=Steinernema carpocapsae TaxID=34508 RepID=A0A4U8UMH2_STECR|nr:hypothetical protein L596_001686 [Steinernema carpocapsae]